MIVREIPSVPGAMAREDGMIKFPDSVARMPHGGLREYKTKWIFGTKTRSSSSARREYYGVVYKGRNYKVHRLMCEAFHGSPPKNKPFVLHIDEDALNNKPENLKWGSQKENLNAPGFIEYCKSRTGENSPVAKARRKKGKHMEQRSKEWFEARKGRLTASSVGAVLGNAPYATRSDVMRRMVREAHGLESEFTGNVATEYGVANEPGALIEYRLETGQDVDAVGFIAKEDWAGCSPDGIIGNGAGGLEVKCPFSKRKDEDPVFSPLKDQPHYYDQVQFSLWVTGLAYWHFFQWSPNGTSFEYVPIDLDWRETNLPKLRQFYAEYLEAVKTPDEYIREKRVVIDTIEASKMLREYDELRDAKDRADERMKAIIGEFEVMSGNSDADICGRKFTKTLREGSVSYAKIVKEKLPDLDLEPYRGKATQFWKLS